MPGQTQKRPSSPPSPNNEEQIAPSGSSTIEDRASRFVALYHPSSSPQVLSILRADARVSDASHRIAAWRRPSAQRSLYPGAAPLVDGGSDDDGEARAGRRVLAVLERARVTGTVVVGRWWGGTMLGPVRFTHIEDVALQAIRAYDAREAADGVDIADAADGAKRRKVEPGQSTKSGLDEKDENAKKLTLLDVLPVRDEHLAILRRLLADKKEALTRLKTPPSVEKVGGNEDAGVNHDTTATPTSSQTPASPQAKVNYAAMPLAALQRLEKARDKSMAFVLAEIEKVEAELGSRERGEAETFGDDQVDLAESNVDTNGEGVMGKKDEATAGRIVAKEAT